MSLFFHVPLMQFRPSKAWCVECFGWFGSQRCWFQTNGVEIACWRLLTCPLGCRPTTSSDCAAVEVGMDRTTWIITSTSWGQGCIRRAIPKKISWVRDTTSPPKSKTYDSTTTHLHCNISTSTTSPKTWGFPEIGLPPIIIHFSYGFCHDKPTSYWGTPICGTPHMW